VAIAKGIVVVFAKEKVGRVTLIRRDHRGRHDRGRVIPPKRSGRFLSRQVATEAKKESAKTVTGISEYPEVNVVIRSDGRRRRAVVGNRGKVTVPRVEQKRAVLEGQGRAIETNQV